MTKKYNLTIFEAKEYSKVPISPFDDKTFIFRTRQISTHFDFLSAIGKYFILNQPFKDSGEEFDFRGFRRISALKDKYQKTFDYIILDVDDVYTREACNKIIEYFKEYKVILGESYSHNGIDNFRMKGVLFCEESTLEEIQHSLNKIKDDLKQFCSIDSSRGFIPSFNAPSHKNKTLFNNEQGKLWEKNQRASITDLSHNVPISDKELDKILNTKTKPELKHTNKDFQEAESIQDICLMYFENLGFESLEPTENGIRFKHSSEVKSPGGFNWNPEFPYSMNHWNPNRSIDAFIEIQKIPRIKEIQKEELKYDSELLSYNPNSVLMKVNERYLTVTKEIQDNIWNFLESPEGIFSIRSPMGTAKSTIINSIIESAHDIGLKALVVTNRISVAEDFAEKYGLKIYNSNSSKEKYNKGDSLICQFDSLWKYNVQDFDLIIMDEFISLMCHARSELKNSSLNLIKFFGCFNKKLVIADAFLTGYERFLLDKKVDKNSYLLDNDYRDNTVLFDYTDKNNFVLQLLHTARKHKITVSSTSLRFLEDLRSLLNSNGLRTVSLTAETPEHTKKLIYETFKEENKNHDKYDVLLYSPTLTVGVSNLNDINYHFHYDSSNSADVISSIQMIKRTRKAKEIHLFVKESFKYLETDYQKLRTQYINNVGEMGDFSVLFEINEYGDVQISETGKKTLKIDIFKNILETNHKEAMMFLMKYHFKNAPRVVDKKFGANILLDFTRSNRENTKQMQLESIQEFLNLSSMDSGYAAEVMEDNNNILNKLASIHEVLNHSLINSCLNPEEIKKEIMQLALNDSGFLDKCRYYDLFCSYLNANYSRTDVKYRMQNYINNSDLELVKFCSKLLKVQVLYSDEYELKEMNNTHLRFILPKCGYNKTSKLGHRLLKIDPNVKKYYSFITEF